MCRFDFNVLAELYGLKYVSQMDNLTLSRSRGKSVPSKVPLRYYHLLSNPNHADGTGI
jgi:hypothetical protein